MTTPQPIDLAKEADFSLGRMRVSPSTREVALGETREALEPRVMQVLVALAGAEGAVVSRDDLIASCWEGRIVGEDAINRAIGRLRRLSESDDGASFAIETIPRVGYRLRTAKQAPDAEAPELSPLTGIPAPSPAPPVPVQRDRVWWLAGAVVLGGVVIALTAGLWWWLTRPPQWAIDSFHMTVSTPLYENYPALAPNGAMIAYSAGPAPFAWHIFIRNLSNGEPIQFTSGPDDDDMHPVWSPSGDAIAFVRHHEGLPCTLVIKPVPAGDERIVGHCRIDDFTSVAWSHAGDALYFNDRADNHKARRVMKLDLASGAVTPVTHPDDDIVGDQQPIISPDGTKLAYVHRAKGVVRQVVLDLASGEITNLPDIPSLNFSKAWIGNDTLLAAAGGMTEPALWILPLHGEPQRIAVNSQELGHISAGPDNLFAIETFRDQFVLASPPAGEERPAVLESTSGATILPEYARDGRLAFVHGGPGGLFDIWIQRPGEASHRVSTLSALFINGLRWSPDGKQFAFYAVIGAVHGLFLINADGTGLRHITQRSTVGMPAWTGDGKGLILPMKDAKGWRLWRLALNAPERAVPVSDYGWFAVRTDGDAIYAISTKGIWRLDGTPKFVATFKRRCTDTFLECQSWLVSGDTLVFADHDDRARPHIVLHSLTDGTERLVVAPGLNNSDQIALDPKTGKLLYVYDGLGDTDIALFRLVRK